MPPLRVRVSRDSVRRAKITRDHSGFKADFDLIYSRVQDAISGDSVLQGGSDQHNLVPLIMTCIRLVERLAKDDAGQAKKELVMALITRIIADSNMSESDKLTLQILLESLGPSIIDGLLDADHGRLLAHGFKKLQQKCGCSSQ